MAVHRSKTATAKIAQPRPRRTRSQQKTERIETRATPEQRRLIEEAAMLSGSSITEFVLSSAQSAAEKVVAEHRIIRLTQRDTIAFLEALANPIACDEKMREIADWHHANVEVKW